MAPLGAFLDPRAKNSTIIDFLKQLTKKIDY